ncbi:hypothetical protein OAB57_01160 [Bacteriovoracaceae bacterium]|nr:hypothetical protein [Bacteriovoracaceae bacterium]
MYTSKNELTFVVYENQKPTKCFEIKKNQLKLLVLSFPILIIFTVVVGLFMAIYIKNISNALDQQEPSIMKKFVVEKNDMIKKQTELQATNKELLSKVTTKSKATFLIPFFRPTLGGKNMTKSHLAKIENHHFVEKGNKVQFSFDILNAQENGVRLAGYIFVIMKVAAQGTLYPTPYKLFNKERNSLYTTFDKGESFSVARFRKVNAMFYKPSDRSMPIYFEVILFSRSGDLYFHKTFGPERLQST